MASHNEKENLPVPDYILKKLILLYAFSKEIQKKTNNFDPLTGTMFDHYFFINGEWINKFKEFYNYDQIIKTINQNKINFQNYEEYKNNIEKIIDTLKHHHYICQRGTEFPIELKNGSICFSAKYTKITGINNMRDMHFLDNLYLVNSELNQLLSQSKENKDNPNLNNTTYKCFISNHLYFVISNNIELGKINSNGMFTPQYYIISGSNMNPETEIKKIIDTGGFEKVIKTKNIQINRMLANFDKKEFILNIEIYKKQQNINNIDINNNHSNSYINKKGIILQNEINDMNQQGETLMLIQNNFMIKNIEETNLKITDSVNNPNTNNTNCNPIINNIQVNNNQNNQFDCQNGFSPQQFGNNIQQNQDNNNYNFNPNNNKNINNIMNSNNMNNNLMINNINNNINININNNINSNQNINNINYNNMDNNNMTPNFDMNNMNMLRNSINNGINMNNNVNMNNINNNNFNNGINTNNMNFIQNINNMNSNNNMDNNKMNNLCFTPSNSQNNLVNISNNMNQNSNMNNMNNNNIMDNINMNNLCLTPNNSQNNLVNISNNLNNMNNIQQNNFNCQPMQNLNNNMNMNSMNILYSIQQLQQPQPQQLVANTPQKQPQNINNNISQQNNPNQGVNPFSLKYFTKVPMIGLVNLGRTCYMNSVLQCFSNLYHITNYFLNPNRMKRVKDHYNSFGAKEDSLLCFAYRDLIENLWKGPENQPFSPIDFKKRLKKLNPLFEDNTAGDSKDFTNYLLMQLHSELNGIETNKDAQTIKNMDDVIVDPFDKQQVFNAFVADFAINNYSIISCYFYGITEGRFECQGCKMKNISSGITTPLIKYNYENFFYLEFPLDEVRKDYAQRNNMLANYQNINEVSIYDCFNYYQKLNTIVGYCEKCNRDDAQINSKNLIFSPPQILILIFNRGKGIQYNIKINFPDIFNLQKITYELQGVVKHFGDNSSSGHFIAYSRTAVPAFKKYWYCFNDHTVVPVNNWADILNNGDTYILFYVSKE